MREAVEALLGKYELQYTETGQLVGGIAGLDYEWLFSAFIIVLFLYSCFRLLGVVLNGK